MPKVELQKTFRVPLDKAIEYFGNHELYNSVHARSDTTITIVSRQNNEILVDVRQDVGGGRTVEYRNRTVLRLPHSIDLETISGVAKGSRQTVTFEPVSEGTKVTYTSDFKMELGGLAGKALRTVSGKMMKRMMKESMEEAAEADRKYLEREPSQPSNPV
jgi:hypothetical protein